jgi:hypothetical protein
MNLKERFKINLIKFKFTGSLLGIFIKRFRLCSSSFKRINSICKDEGITKAAYVLPLTTLGS